MNNDFLSGQITGPNLISLIDLIAPRDHDDMTDCTSIATASADIAAARFMQPQKWLDEYVRTLMFLGWRLHDDTITTRTRHVLSGNIADFLVQNADMMKDAQQANAMIDTLDALRPHNAALAYLDTETHYGDRLQVIPSRYDAKGNLHIGIFSLELVVEKKQGGFLFWNWQEQSARLVQQKAFLKLDKEALDSQRPLMERKLRDIRMQRFALKRQQS